MTALNDAERAVQRWTTEPSKRAVHMPQPHPEKTAESTPTKTSTTWLPTRRFFAAVIAIAGMQLMATMDGTIAIVALPKIQNELSLSDAGRSWVITAYVLTFGGLMLLGGRLGDTIGAVRHRLGRRHAGDCTAAAGRGRRDRLANRLRAGRHHVRQGAGTQRRHRDIRRNDGYRFRDGSSGRWGAY